MPRPPGVTVPAIILRPSHHHRKRDYGWERGTGVKPDGSK
jgi:hypothetical protein